MADRPTLHELEHHDGFVGRHIGTTSGPDTEALLDALGVTSLEALVEAIVPDAIRSTEPLALPQARTEVEVIERLRELAARNRVVTSLIGMGFTASVMPPVVQRNVLEDPAWYTSYTPYQAEISQGRLEALLNFQTMVADLTGMDLAGASLLDEASAAAEAMTMTRRLVPTGPAAWFVDADCHPSTLAVLATRAEPLGIELIVGDPQVDLDPEAVFGALLQAPASTGAVRDLRPVIERVHAAGGLVTVATDLLACVVVEPPGAQGADLVVGSAQRFGVPLGYGGPSAAFLATRAEHSRALPGRLVGMSTDAAGRPAARLALQTREQHIRREKATSNICTAQALLANLAGFYAVWHGPDGLTRIAERVHRLTSVLAAGLRADGLALVHDTWFDTLAVGVPGRADAVLAAALEQGLNLRRIDADTVGMTLDETSTRATAAAVWAAFGVVGDDEQAAALVAELDATAPDGIPEALRRSGDLLTHPVFSRYHSEHEMLRYLRRLADRDLALDRTMIPLGSCTMKLNATTEMLPITWPEFAAIHPFAPPDQAEGYTELIAELGDALLACTGYDAVSVQPNAGSQGELAGLLAVRAWHRARGDVDRVVCLIPTSAHGTNAASAVLAGMRVVPVRCDEAGDVDLADLEAKAAAAGATLAAVMVTYPSTHGVFEDGITEVCRIVHDHGGQVYLDGANLNALVGLAQPGRFGADVSHLNLHKTFCIPHGGGGPGVGPVVVREHLAPFLPGHPLAPGGGTGTGGGVGPLTAAPFGSAGILPISWAYIALMGAEGLRTATVRAIAHANYVARRLAPAYPVLYRGRDGHLAHECIIDLRPLTKATGITVDDVAKRLMDYGFHAPTMSFPVAGTLMVEPTESEGLAELDRFCDAMVAIRAEIERVAVGEWPRDDNPLVRAPHTADDVATDTWDRPYSRDVAAYPVASLRRTAKYWPPVGRVDAARGDRQLMCSCPPIEAYE